MELHILPKPLLWTPLAGNTLQHSITPFGSYVIIRRAKRAFELKTNPDTKLEMRVGSYPTIAQAKEAAEQVHMDFANRFFNTNYHVEER